MSEAYAGGSPFALLTVRRFRVSEQQQAQQTGKKVLVVDDDDAIRNMVERILRREHFEVESARDGFEAIEKLARNDYGTVLLDLMMPRIDGHGVLRFLETELKDPQPRVIVMSANLPGADRTRDAAPVFRILPKPFDIHELVSHVRQCHGESVGSSQ
jgi:DNA-binding response OmpR family regulator